MVGAGLAGLTAARELGRLGHRVEVFEGREADRLSAPDRLDATDMPKRYLDGAIETGLRAARETDAILA